MTSLLEDALELQEKVSDAFVPKGSIAQHVLFLTDTSRQWPQLVIVLHGRCWHGYSDTRTHHAKTMQAQHKLGN